MVDCDHLLGLHIVNFGSFKQKIYSMINMLVLHEYALILISMDVRTHFLVLGRATYLPLHTQTMSRSQLASNFDVSLISN